MSGLESHFDIQVHVEHVYCGVEHSVLIGRANVICDILLEVPEADINVCWDNNRFVIITPVLRDHATIIFKYRTISRKYTFDPEQNVTNISAMIANVPTSCITRVLRALGLYSNDWHTIIKSLLLYEASNIEIAGLSYEELEVLNTLKNVIIDYDPAGWQSCIDGFDSVYVTGWAKRASEEESQEIDILINSHILKNSYKADAWREDIQAAGIGTGKYSFKVALDSKCFQSNIVFIALCDPKNGRIFDFRFYEFDYGALKYTVRIEQVIPELRGWAITNDCPDRQFDIDISLDGAYLATIRNDRARGDLREKNLTSGSGGFFLQMQDELLLAGMHKLSLTLHGGRHVENVEFEVAGRMPDPIADISILEKQVSIIIPFYNDPCLEECLEYVFAYTPANARIIIVDDCSPQIHAASIIGKLTSFHNINIVRNEVNLGFAGAVNVGIAAAGEDDVVLLNQDVRVTPGWLRNLLLVAASAPRIASVTPMSDRAGAFSAPSPGNDNPLPFGATEAEYARAFKRASFHLYPVVPTGHGFCMYMNRACINEIGAMDAEMFSPLYGEENDWCMRALRAGWQHLVADNVYVYHERNESFSPGRAEHMRRGVARVKERYPEYANALTVFSSGKKLASARFAARLAAANWRELAKPRILFVIGTLSGGTPQTNADLMGAFSENAQCYLLSCDTRELRLHVQKGDRLVLLYSRKLKNPIDPVSHVSPEYDAIVTGWLYELDIDIVHFRCLIWHSLSIMEAAAKIGCKTIFSFHDFYALSPSVHLLDDAGVFRGEDFVPQGSVYRPELWNRAGMGELPVQDPAYRQHWKRRFLRYLRFCDAYVTTSVEARDIILAEMPGLEVAKFHIIPHGRDFAQMLSVKANYLPGEPMRILVLGNIGPHKGKCLVESLSAYDGAHDDLLRFHVLGHSSGPRARFVRHGIYDRNNVAQKVEKIRPHTAIIFSIWGETWCHTLTELWSMGIPAIVLDFGTVARRVRECGGGWVMPFDDIPQIYERIIDIVSSPEEQKRAELAVARWQAGEGCAHSTSFMANAYYRLYHNLLQAHHTQEFGKIPVIAVSSKEGMGSSYLRLLDPCRNDFRRKVSYLSVTGSQLRALLDGGLVDGAIIQRDWLPGILASECVALAEARRIPLCLEIDDDLLEKPAPAGRKKGLEHLLGHACMVTTTNEELASRLRHLNKRVCVRQSRLGKGRWPGQLLPRQQDGLVRALYYGTPDHVEDVRLILPAVKEINAKYSFFRLALIRIGEDMEDDLAGLEFVERYDVSREERPLPQFVARVAALLPKMDFAIAPLVDTRFNRAKSWIKVIEYGALGLCAIASNVSPYAVAPPLPGLLLCENTVQAWIQALEAKILLGSRNRMQGLLAREYVWEHCMQNEEADAEFDDLVLAWLDCHQNDEPRDKKP